MRNFYHFQSVLWAMIFAIAGLSIVSTQNADAKKSDSHARFVKHVITLQLADSLGFPVSGTQFDVTITLVKIGSQVTVYLPMILQPFC
jgi:glucose uptake protein GlcU